MMIAIQTYSIYRNTDHNNKDKHSSTSCSTVWLMSILGLGHRLENNKKAESQSDFR